MILLPGRYPALEKKFYGHLRETARGCWIWQACREKSGYGNVRWRGKTRKTHRLMYMLFFGKFPTHRETDHLCKNKACCNPAHIEAVHHVVNVRRGDAGKYLLKRKSCPRGHSYRGKNLYTYPNGDRACRICRRMYIKNFWNKRRAA